MPLVNVTHLQASFDDEFNTFTGSPDGSSGWMTQFAQPTVAGARSMPTELEFYSDSSVGVNPFSVSNGVLSITAAPTSPTSNSLNRPYTSGVITTHGSFSQTYGYYEIRAQLPAGDGLFPAFWMLPANGSSVSEIDQLEVKGSDTTQLLSTSISNEVGIQAIDKVTNLAVGYHVFGLDWEPNTLTYYLDGKPLATLPAPSAVTAMYLLLNLAVGAPGSFEGTVDATTVFPAALNVDYVRAYATNYTLSEGGRSAIFAGPSAIPTLVGEFGPQASVDGTGVAPFANAKIVDSSGQADTVAVTLSDTTHGTLTNLAGWTVSGATYTYTGTAAAATAALQGLVFLPGAAGANTVATTFTLAVSNASGAASPVATVLSETHGAFTGAAQVVDGSLAPASGGPLTFTDNGAANAIYGGTAGLNLTVNANGDTVFTHAGSTNTVLLNTINNTVESYGNDTVTGTAPFYTTTEWLEVKGANQSVTYNGDRATVHILGTNATFTANGQITYIVTKGTQTVNLNGYFDYVSGDGGLLTVKDTGTHSTISAGTGGLVATLDASLDDVTTLNGVTNTIVVNSGSSNVLHSNGTDTITLKSGGNTVLAMGTATITDQAGGNTITLQGLDTVTTSGLADLVDVSGSVAEAVTVTNGSTVSGNGGMLTVTETGSGATVWAGYATTRVIEGAGPDTVVFGPGTTVVSGGAGAATYSFVYGSGGGQNTISGFQAGVDKIVFSGFTGNPVQNQSVVNGSLTIKLTDNTTVFLPGQTNAGLDAPRYFIANSGQVTSGATIGPIDAGLVYAGGLATNNTLSGGNLVVVSGAASGTTVLSGATEFLLAGTDTGAIVGAGGVLTISGGVDSGALLQSGGQAIVFGGAVVSATVASGGQLLLASGTASGVTVSGGAFVQSAGVVTGTTVLAGGVFTMSGGTESGTVVNLGGSEVILSGTVASASTVSSGGTQVLRAGGSELGVRLQDGARLDLASLAFGSGGSASYNAASGTLSVTEGGVTVSEGLSGSYTSATYALTADGTGGTLVTVSNPPPPPPPVSSGVHKPVYYYINSGQSSSGLVLSSGDGAFVFAGGAANAASVTSGALLLVLSGTASGAAISSGGNEFVIAGSNVAATVSSGGTLTVSGGTDSGAVIGSGAMAYVAQGGTVLGATVSSGGTIAAVSGAVVSNTLLSPGGRIDLLNLAFGTGGVSFNSATNVLSVTENGVTVTETLRGVTSGAGFAVAADGNGGTLVTAASGPVMVSGPHVPVYTYVNAGQTVSGLVVSGGDAAFVNSGGSLAAATVSSGGLLLVNGGAASGTVVLSGGNEFVQLGSERGNAVGAGGSLTVSGGVDSGAVVSSGGVAVVFGGALSGASVLGGGQLMVAGGTVVSASVSGALVQTGGMLSGTSVVGGSLTMSAGLDLGSVLGSGGMEFVGSGTVASGTTVSSGGVQVVLAGGAASGTQLLVGGKLDLAGQSFAGASGFAFNSTTDVLTFSEGGAAQSLTLRGGYTGTALQYGADAKGGLVISVVSGA